MSIQPDQHVADALIAELNRVNQAMNVADTAYNSLLVARDKVRADLDANDEVRTGLAEKRDALHAHLALVAPPLSDEDRAALESRPGVIE